MQSWNASRVVCVNLKLAEFATVLSSSPQSSTHGWWTTGVGCSLWTALSGMKNDIITVIPLPWILSEGLKNTSGVHDIMSLTACVFVKLDGKTRQTPKSISFPQTAAGILSLFWIKIYGCFFMHLKTVKQHCICSDAEWAKCRFNLVLQVRVV